MFKIRWTYCDYFLKNVALIIGFQAISRIKEGFLEVFVKSKIPVNVSFLNIIKTFAGLIGFMWFVEVFALSVNPVRI